MSLYPSLLNHDQVAFWDEGKQKVALEAKVAFRDDSSHRGRWYEKQLHHSCFEHRRGFWLRTVTKAQIFNLLSF